MWRRPEVVEFEVTPDTTRRQLFSICGRLVSHFPAAGWVRVAASYAKRMGKGDDWEAPIGDEAAAFMNIVRRELRKADSAKGEWLLRPDQPVTVWCDASSQAVGVAVEIDDAIVEDRVAPKGPGRRQPSHQSVRVGRRAQGR